LGATEVTILFLVFLGLIGLLVWWVARQMRP
jgi:hypothetical protein